MQYRLVRSGGTVAMGSIGSMKPFTFQKRDRPFKTSTALRGVGVYQKSIFVDIKGILRGL